MTTHVWYAAYGSNCADDRFDCYLSGGRPAGSTKVHTGCRDATPPTGVRGVTIAWPMYFGGWSPYWGGAVSYLDPHRDDDAATLAVARRLTVDQFSDIVAQESGGLALSADLPMADVLATGRVDIGGAYGTVVLLGDIDSEPVVTCTAAGRRIAGEPTDDYIATVRRGLITRWPAVVVDRYLDDVYAEAVLTATASRRIHHATTDDSSWWLDDFDEWDRLDDTWGDHADRQLVAP